MAGINNLTLVQIERVDVLIHHSWSLDKIWHDAISLSKVVRGRVDGVEFTERVMVFVDLDGKVHRPRTNGTMAASSELYDLGLLQRGADA